MKYILTILALSFTLTANAYQNEDKDIDDLENCAVFNSTALDEFYPAKKIDCDVRNNYAHPGDAKYGMKADEVMRRFGFADDVRLVSRIGRQTKYLIYNTLTGRVILELRYDKVVDVREYQ